MGLPAKQPAQMFVERRESERVSVNHAALGLTPMRAEALNCLVLDLSVGGARVEIRDVDLVPRNFKLFIPEAGWLYSCEVIRRNGQEVGVKFLSKEPFKPFKFRVKPDPIS